MALSPAFSISVTSAASTFILTDTSTGSDGTLTARSIIITRNDGTQYYSGTWPLVQSTITLPILTTDIALNIVVNWLAGSTVVYSVSHIYPFNGFANNFLYYLTQLQTSNPSIIQDKGYYYNKMILFVEMSSSQNAINVGNDLSGAQYCIDRYNNLISNQQYYF